MTLFRIIAAAVALLAAACSPPAAQAPPQTEAQAQTQADTAAPTAAPDPKAEDGKPNAPAAQAASAPTPAMLVGRWGDNGDCTKDIVFAGDGTFRSYTGGEGRWSLNGDRMTMSGSGGVFEVRVQIVNSNVLLIQNADGSIGTSQRC
jgi:hypothetical protein